MLERPRSEAAIWYGRKFDDIDGELAKYVTICKLDLLNPDLVERVLRNDASVCPDLGCEGFAKMRQLLIMHFLVRSEAVESLGQARTEALIRDVLVRLRARLAPRHPPSRWSASSTKPSPARRIVT